MISVHSLQRGTKKAIEAKLKKKKEPKEDRNKEAANHNCGVG